MSPPKKVAAPLPSRAATTLNSPDSSPDNWRAGFKRRRAASRRLAILDCGRSDPWHYADVPLTDHQLDAWRQTIDHLTSAGFRPLVRVNVARALWRRGDLEHVEKLTVPQ